MFKDRPAPNLPPFSPEYRASGLLLHVTSLPSKYGIGDLGPSACRWIDYLHDSRQCWWQALPLGPTGYGNSPYQPLSTFAGNGLLISPELLIEDGLLHASDCEGLTFSDTSIDYEAVIAFKHGLLEKIWTNWNADAPADLRKSFEEFRAIHSHWLEDYALFRALKERFGRAYYLDWPPDLVRRISSAMVQARREMASWIEQICFAQFILFRQWARLKAYAHAKDVFLIGDLPFYVSPDSSDVWVNPELFLLDDQFRPRFVAGVPPDYFSVQGQLWGNPVFDWDVLRRSGYSWWIERIRTLLERVDVIRLDHFRAFSAAWCVPAESSTAQTGHWVLGPGAQFFRAVKRKLGSLPFIAEDLGIITPEVCVLRDTFHLPGMRVLQFAFDGNPNNPHLPHNYVSNTVVYTGTHDNPPTRAWYEELPDYQRGMFWNSLGRPAGDSSEAALELMRMAWLSPAAVAIAPLQDLLNLGEEARMNVPGRAEGNWRWRATEDMLASPAFRALRDLTEASGRTAVLK